MFIGLLLPVYAATPWGDCVKEEAAQITCIVPLFTNIVQGVLSLSGVALFVMLVLGGYNFLFSGGDQKKLEAAKGTLTSAIIGLVVIVAAYLIINAIQLFTKSTIPVTQFKLNFSP